jgi:two-component system phosphate regulon response regulator OmpR|tara:strand:+ start:216 stop:893 length:678 start_codon:yes stop_codon:yes gene_type:complete
MKEFEAHILVIDDDKGIRELVREFLNENNFITSTAKDASEAKEKVSLIKFDLIILDIMMPGKSGLEFLQENKKYLDTPIILLTAKGEAIDRIEGLETGADDYLSKPFEPKELILRIRNILNRTNIIKDRKEIEFGNIKINLNKMIIFRNNKQIKINNTEKKIFEKMLNSPGKVFSRESIGKLINIDKERSIDVIVTRLRKKIEENPKNPKYLQTIRGEGYVLWVE